MGESNSVAFQFNRVGAIVYPPSAASADDMMDAAIEAGAEDVESDEAGHEVTTAIDQLFAVRDALEARFGAPDSAKLDWRPSVTITVDDEERAAALVKLLDALEENDDVQTVYSNADIPDAVMERLAA
jgi:transcriptional/translational regulatory protein YebC/TACO1